MTLPDLRSELAKREARLLADITLFNDLHRRAKHLKKKMVEDRKEIDRLEGEIRAKK